MQINLVFYPYGDDDVDDNKEDNDHEDSNNDDSNICVSFLLLL